MLSCCSSACCFLEIFFSYFSKRFWGAFLFVRVKCFFISVSLELNDAFGRLSDSSIGAKRKHLQNTGCLSQTFLHQIVTPRYYAETRNTIIDMEEKLFLFCETCTRLDQSYLRFHEVLSTSDGSGSGPSPKARARTAILRSPSPSEPDFSKARKARGSRVQNPARPDPFFSLKISC